MTNTDETDFAKRHPQDGEKFRSLLAPIRPLWEFSIYSVKDNSFPDNIHVFDGFIITGSPASVHDDEPWIARLLTLIQEIHTTAIPLFGACFGHQAIAQALGGVVEKNPGDWVFGRVDTTLEQPWDNVTRNLSLYAAHVEQVTALPPNAIATGNSEGCKFASFAIGDNLWTTQYHPEMTPTFIAELVEEYASELPPEVVSTARKSLKKKADTDTIADSIASFFKFASQH